MCCFISDTSQSRILQGLHYCLFGYGKNCLCAILSKPSDVIYGPGLVDGSLRGRISNLVRYFLTSQQTFGLARPEGSGSYGAEAYSRVTAKVVRERENDRARDDGNIGPAHRVLQICPARSRRQGRNPYFLDDLARLKDGFPRSREEVVKQDPRTAQA